MHKRKHTRFDIDLKITYSNNAIVSSAASKNICMGGVFIYTTKPLDVDSTVNLAVQLPDDNQAIEIQGGIVHSLKGIGMGIQFTKFDEAGKKQLKTFLQKQGRNPDKSTHPPEASSD